MYRLLKKRAIALVMMLIMIITLVSANEVSAKTSKKAVPALKESSATLYVKGKYATEYQIEIENLVSGATVTYESSDEKIATVKVISHLR